MINNMNGNNNEVEVYATNVNSEEKEDAVMNENQKAVTIKEEENAMNENQKVVTTEEAEAMSENQKAVTAKEENTMNENQSTVTSLTTQAGTSLQKYPRVEVVPSKVSTLADRLNEFDKAVDNPAEKERMEKFWLDAQRSAIKDLWQIRNVLNDSLYAGIFENEDGSRRIEFCQRYVSGNFSPRMSVMQADLITAVAAITIDAYKEDKEIQRAASRFFKKIGKDYLGKFHGEGGEVLPIKDVMMALSAALPTLPTPEDSYSEERMDFYNRAVKLVEDLMAQRLGDHEAYYVIMEDEIADVAKGMGMSRLAFLKKLRSYGLLYLTPSSRGYQTNVRFKDGNGNTYTERHYCMFKSAYFTESEEETATNSYDF